MAGRYNYKTVTVSPTVTLTPTVLVIVNSVMNDEIERPRPLAVTPARHSMQCLVLFTSLNITGVFSMSMP